ncbi:MAG: hypothetical protein ACREFO_13340 [Acetobacteraceae bacterium]
MISSEYLLAVPALAVIWPCLAVAVMFGCAWGLAAQGLPTAARLPITS